MILDNPEDAFSRVLKKDDKTIEELGSALYNMAMKTSIKSYFSRKVPGVPAASMILFLFYKNNIGYFLYYTDGKIFFKPLSKIEDIFTPNILDLDTLWPVSKEDVNRRISS